MFNSNTTPISLFLNSVRNLKFLVFKYVSLRTVSACLLALFPYFYKLLLDSLSLGSKKSLVFVLLLITGVLILGNILAHIAGNIFSKLWGHSEKQAFEDVYNYFSKHDANYFANSIAGKLNADFLSFKQCISSSMLLLQNIDLYVTLFTSIFLIFFFNYKIGLIILIFILLKIIISNQFFKIIKDLQFKSSKFQSLGLGWVSDSIANFTNIKLFNLQKFEKYEITKRLVKYLEINVERKYAENNRSTLLSFLFNFFQILIYYLCLSFYFANIITIGDVMLFISAIRNIEINLNFSMNFFKSYYDDYGTLKNSLNSIIVKQGDLDPESAKNLNSKNPSITFKNLNFKYENKLIFKNFNLHIKAGEKLGIVGSSGAGKSTLLSILTAEYKAPKNQYFLDENESSELKLSEIRKNFSVVSQDTLLFNASIKDNITLYSKYPKKLVIQALKKAHLYKYVQSLPNKLETLVGERGVKLSGGQKQRLGIARSILHDAPILILDEATSALDSKTEKYIQDSLELAMQNKTVIAVAHRLSTLANMDRIIVLEKGKIIEEGTHKQLLRMKGKYYDLWQHQSKGLI